MNEFYIVSEIKPGIYVQQLPYVGDDGIYVPIDEYVLEGYKVTYRMIMSKEMFIEAYSKWIKGEEAE